MPPRTHNVIGTPTRNASKAVEDERIENVEGGCYETAKNNAFKDRMLARGRHFQRQTEQVVGGQRDAEGAAEGLPFISGSARIVARGCAPIRGVGGTKIDRRGSDGEVHEVLRAGILETMDIAFDETDNVTLLEGFGPRPAQ